MSKAEPKDMVIVAVNRKARHDYHILETLEAGIELKGSEVKSLRESMANLKEGYADIRGGELFLEGVHLKSYSHDSERSLNPTRSRRLLAHRKQLRKLEDAMQKERLAVIPLRLYFKRGWAKVELGIGKGKKLYDKRESKKKAESLRDIDREVRKRQKN